MVGSGHSVGGVVSSDVGAGGCASNGEGTPARQAQLQRIISRCGCQFFYASFGEQGIDPATLNEVPPLVSISRKRTMAMVTLWSLSVLHQNTSDELCKI